MEKNKIAIIQPVYADYREQFFFRLEKTFSIDFFQVSRKIEEGYNLITSLKIKRIKAIYLSKAVFFYLPISFFFKYKIIVLPGEFKYITNWYILLLGKITGTKVIIWWQGLDWRKRISDDEDISFIPRVYEKLSSGMLLYTEKEQKLWRKYTNSNKIHVLNNSIDTKPIIKNFHKLHKNKHEYKIKHNIIQKNVFIYCARFSNPYRRTDIMLELIEILDKNEYGFIIIGEGKYKPDFSKYSNVYDFNAVYDRILKNELFIIADLYFQPGAIGLSIVEAMGYSLPVLTLERSKLTKHGTEYGYLIHNKNAYIAKDIHDMKSFVNTYFNNVELQKKIKRNTIMYVEENLSIEKMIDNATMALSNYL